MKIQAPYLLFLGDANDELSIKMAKGVADWRPEQCVGEYRLDNCTVSTGQPAMDIKAAKAAGAKTFVLSFANSGGTIDPAWIPFIIEALENDMHVVSGLHQKLTDIEQVRELAKRRGLDLIDIRHPSQSFNTGKGYKRSGKRLITVGTDCSVGKMYTSLCIEKAMKAQGFDVDFRASGQCGILIAGDGVAIDCVVADFIAGASETLSPDNSSEHWDIVEGQGALSHPAFAGVSLGLLHGAQPDAIVICHAINRATMRGLDDRPLPSIAQTIELNLAAARVTNPNVKVAAIAVNTSSVDEREALKICSAIAIEHNLPCVDPVRHGVDAIIGNLT
ncbi:MAG: EBNA-1 nuclear protein [Gammaproteobacteria bacterium MedPE]|nr:MAG: EBNA-1 nuclear protein [Gammaproteobacteria bacterium MedPE]